MPNRCQLRSVSRDSEHLCSGLTIKEEAILSRRLIQLEMNRVEGDLQIKLEVERNTVTDAWCIGSMYRGYEQVLDWEGTDRCARIRATYLRDMQYISLVCGDFSP